MARLEANSHQTDQVEEGSAGSRTAFRAIGALATTVLCFITAFVALNLGDYLAHPESYYGVWGTDYFGARFATELRFLRLSVAEGLLVAWAWPASFISANPLVRVSVRAGAVGAFVALQILIRLI